MRSQTVVRERLVAWPRKLINQATSIYGHSTHEGHRVSDCRSLNHFQGTSQSLTAQRPHMQETASGQPCGPQTGPAVVC
jgi:hypothetical protein